VKYIEIGDARYLWRDILKLRRDQRKTSRQQQPTLFELRHDHRPPSQATAAG
jgi:hypothetical protein